MVKSLANPKSVPAIWKNEMINPRVQEKFSELF